MQHLKVSFLQSLGNAERKPRKIDSVPFPMNSVKVFPLLWTSERLRQRSFH